MGLEGDGALPSTGAYQSRRVRSGGQRAKEGVGGVLKLAEFAATVLSPKDVSVKGKTSEDAVTW